MALPPAERFNTFDFRITSHADRSDCRCSPRHWRWNRTRCTCLHRDRDDASDSGHRCSPGRNWTNRTTRNASRHHDAHASDPVHTYIHDHSSSIHNACTSSPYTILLSSFPRDCPQQKHDYRNLSPSLSRETDTLYPLPSHRHGEPFTLSGTRMISRANLPRQPSAQT